jgi:hypothetical protein
MPYQPVIIIGAPRSGTNILRDVLTSLPNVATWPCDEINYIWRHGNTGHHADAFTPEMAHSKCRKYIRSKFASLARSTGSTVVLEKTCANSLRVGFVSAVLPEAKYIFIVRDGRDVVPSAMKRWQGIMELPLLPYLMQKVRFVPPFDLPVYAVRYLAAQVHRCFSNDKRLSVWGPRFDGMEAFCRTHSLPEICAMQWKCCVERAEQDFARFPREKVCRVRYEDLTADPVGEIKRLLGFLAVSAPEEEIARYAAVISPRHTNAWDTRLGEEDRQRVLPLIRPLLEQYGYWDQSADPLDRKITNR